MPKTTEEIIGDKKIEIRSGYMNYNLVISLAKQLFISLALNENKIIKQMFFEGFDKVINESFTDKTTLLLIEVLDKLNLVILNIKTIN